MQRHEVDPNSLAFGLLFMLAGLTLLTGDASRGTLWLGWVAPLVAIGCGLLLILAVRPRRTASETDPLTDAAPEADRPE